MFLLPHHLRNTSLTFRSLLFSAGFYILPLPVLAQGLNFTWKSYIGPSSIEELILAILNVLITLAIPIVVLFIIYAGFLYVTARGNSQQVEQATRALTYAIIGGVLIIGAVAISGMIANLVSSFQS